MCVITYSLKDIVDVSIVGNKAHNLMVMSSLGIPVPKGFVIPINLNDFSEEEIYQEFLTHQLKFPVSVRSSGVISMPGMMDTILNVGANSQTFLEESDDSAFKLECYFRLIQSFSTCVFGFDADPFYQIEKAANDFYIDDPVAMNSKIVDRFLYLWNKNAQFDFPVDCGSQLFLAATAVKESWYSRRAFDYREAEKISHDGGTAVIVQEMVFGNRNEKSGTGVVFSHNPNSGKPELYGDFLPSAQGEDIVSGSKVPRSIESMLADERFRKSGKQLKSHISRLIRYFKFMQDVEFTIDNGELYILQTRNGKCSPKAAVRSALSMVNNGSMSILEATDMVMESLPAFDSNKLSLNESSLVRIGFGIGVAEGEAAGYLTSSKEYAEHLRVEGKPYIFCAEFTSPEDIEVMRYSAGVVTSMGGRLSHAAILARSMSKPTIVGFEKMIITSEGFCVEDETYRNGDMIKIDGTTGTIFYSAQNSQLQSSV